MRHIVPSAAFPSSQLVPRDDRCQLPRRRRYWTPWWTRRCLSLRSFIVVATLLASGLPDVDSTAAEPPPAPLVLAESVRPTAPGGQPTRFGLTRADLDVLVQSLPTLVRAIPIRHLQDDIRYGEQIVTGRVIGTTPDYASLHHLKLERGRFLTTDDSEGLRSVAVLGSQVARQLFPTVDPIGQSVRVGRQYFVVVGTISRADRQRRLDLLLPLSTMHSRMGDRIVRREAGSFELQEVELTAIELELRAWTDVTPAAAIAREVLSSRHPDGSVRVIDTLEQLRALEAGRTPRGLSP